MHKILLLIYLFFYSFSFSHNAIELNNSASIKYNNKDYKGAVLDLNKAIITDSKNAVSYNNSGLAYYKLEEYNKAINDYVMAIKLNSKFTAAYRNRGNAKSGLMNYVEAIKDYSLFLIVNPNDAAILNDRGFARTQLKDYENAIIDLNKSIEINPNYAIAYYNRGTCKYKLGQKENGCDDYLKSSNLGFSVADKTFTKFCIDEIKQTENSIVSNNIIRDKHIRATEVLGYFNGIELTLEAISINFPDLNYEVNRIKLLYKANFGLCKKNAINYLKEFKVWPEIENKLKVSTEELRKKIESNIVFSLKENSQKYLVEVEEKLKGNIESPILENLLSFQYQDFPKNEFNNGFTNTFSTKGHSKSKNAEWSIKYPKSWMAKEGDGINIIQKFVNDCGDGFNMFTMVTREIPTDESEKNLSPKEIDELYKNEFFIEENIKDFLPDNAKFISFKPMKIANCPGSLLVFDMIQERLGNQIKSRGYQFIFKNKSYLHVLHCSIISTDVNEDLNLKEKIFFPLYESIANSIIITNKNEDIIYLKGDEYQKLIEVEINNKNYDFILDTGATQSLINKSLINELISKKLITKDNYLSKGIAVLANGDSVEIEIWKIPTLKIGNKTINNLYFSVINDNNFIPLLGMDILQRLDIWKIDLNNDKIYLKN